MHNGKPHDPSRKEQYKAPNNYNKDNNKRSISDYFGKQAKAKKSFDEGYRTT